MSYPRAVLLAWALALMLACLLAYDMAHAGVFIEGQLGASYMIQTAPDGLWRQEAFGSSYQGTKLAYGARIGYRFERPWSVQAGAISFGTNRTESRAVADGCYNPVSHTVTCNTQPMHVKTADSMRGYTLSVTRYFALSATWSVPVSLGAALVTHRLRADDSFHPQFKQERYGRMPMWSVGAGVCWREWLCWENTLYEAVRGGSYEDETSSRVITSTVGVRYHF